MQPVSSHAQVKEEKATQTHFAGNLQLAVLLVLEYVNPNSAWRSWLDVLPSPTGPLLYNAPNLTPPVARRMLAQAAINGGTPLRGAELRAVIHDVDERLCGYKEWMMEEMVDRHPVIKTMIARLAKARFNGKIDPAIDLFFWALSMVDSRANDGVNNIDFESPLMELDPWMHLSNDGKQALEATRAAQAARRRKAEANLNHPQHRVPVKFRDVENETVPDPDDMPGSKLPDLSQLPISITPTMVPYLDMLNHADGGLLANVDIHAGGLPPFSPMERRMYIRSLRRCVCKQSQSEFAPFQNTCD
jgi:hypothetical protein